MTREQIINKHPLLKYCRERGYEVRRAGNQFSCRCPLPGHNDGTPSFFVNPEKATWYCHGCKKGGSVVDLHMALYGLTLAEAMKDLGGEKNKQDSLGEEVASYPYTDENGIKISEVVRFKPKTFRQFKVNEYGERVWKGGMGNTRRVVYHLPEVIAASEVFIVEGEKDADTLMAIDRVGTCNPGGAGKWRSEFNEHFYGKRVFIIADRDEVGRKHADEIANHLVEIASRVAMIELPNGSKDISDFATLHGVGFSDAFSELLESAHEFVPSSNDDAPRVEDDLHKRSAKTELEDCIILPSGTLGIYETAEKAFRIIAKSKKLFVRGGRVFELIRDKKDQALRLEILSEQSFRSRIELHGRILAWRADPHGGYVLKSGARCSLDTATVWLASSAIDVLPPIVAVHRSPIITQNGVSMSTKILAKGYHSDCGGRFVSNGETSPTKMELSDAVELLLDSVSEFTFQTTADKSRAISAIITPALVFGELFTAHVPVFVIEADKSQTGKGFFLELMQTIFGEIPSIITQRQGGVGGFDEFLSQALLNGRPFVQLDNMRGRLISQYLEMIMTCPPNGSVGARVPYKGETQIQPSRFIFQLTSNGFESTRDLANRSCIIRLLKRQGYAFRKYPEGDLLDHIRAHQGKYQSAVFRVVEEWVKRGKPITTDTRGEGKFRRWAQAFDWIIQEFFNLPPLMDGHAQAQERTANPALSWLRQVCIAAEFDSRLDEDLTATDIIEICHGHSIEIPGLAADATEKKTQLRVGTIIGKIFKEGDVVEGDGFTIEKTTETQYDEDTRHEFELKKYKIRREAACVQQTAIATNATNRVNLPREC